jgi:hypothetical protein
MRYAAILLILALTLWGCVSTKRSRPGEYNTADAKSGETVDKTAEREKSGNEGSTFRAAGHDGKPGETDAVPENPKKEAPLTPVEVERYTESIMNVIESLEACYATGDFERWKSLLTPLYREKHDDPAYLQAQGWSAAGLYSFFKLLISTRKQGNVTALKISRIEFEKPWKALVFVILEEREFPEPQHTFIKIGDKWLKGLPEEGG